LFTVQAWYADFLLEIDLKILLRKTGARLNFKIALIPLHIDPDEFIFKNYKRCIQATKITHY
jgi:hypothetical protein